MVISAQGDRITKFLIALLCDKITFPKMLLFSQAEANNPDKRPNKNSLHEHCWEFPSESTEKHIRAFILLYPSSSPPPKMQWEEPFSQVNTRSWESDGERVPYTTL